MEIQPMHPTHEDDIGLAVVLLAHGEAPDGAKLLAATSRFGLALRLSDETPSNSGVTLVGDAGVTACVMTMGFPHPDAQRTLRAGPTSIKVADARGAADHVMVVVQGLRGTPRERDGYLAKVTAGVIDTMPAIAAMLGHGAVFHKARLFRDAVAGATGKDVPVVLAADITLAAEADGRLSMLTHGMPRHGREELFVTAPVAQGNDAAKFTLGLIRWMLAEPTKQFPTGDTVGRSATERVKVRRVPHPYRQDEVVVRLDL